MSPWLAWVCAAALAHAQETPVEDEPPGEEDEAVFGATARAAPIVVPGATRLTLEETRDVPGAFGDPFRVTETLPGVTPVFSGLPFVYIRSAPPSGTLHVYDEITLPALYHLAAGPAVLHPRMVGPVRLYAGVSPARYGRLIGGVILGEGPPPPEDPTRPHGEVELRVLDVNGYVQAPVGGGHAQVAGRYGYPALLLSIFTPEVDLAYWDYQIRYDRPLGDRDRFQLVVFGAFDSFRQTGDELQRLEIHFHRAEARFIRRTGPLSLGVALQAAWERSRLGESLEVMAFRIGPRLWIEHRSPTVRWRVGADLTGVVGDLSDPGGDASSDPTGIELEADVSGRSIGGVHAELVLRPLPDFELELGGRVDTWVSSGLAEASIDPRARLTWHARDDLHFHVAAGVMRQPVTYPLPLPGMGDVAIARGLQTSLQTEAGVAADLPGGWRAEAQAFWHAYDGVIFPDDFFLESPCNEAFCEDLDLDFRTDGTAYGAELFLRRESGARVSGWLSYTLAWSRVDPILGLPFTPNTDTRHVANLVLQLDLGRGFTAGVRVFARSGKPVGEFRIPIEDPTLRRVETRLPPFLRIDALIAYAWRTSWGRLRVALEWFNTTLAQEALGLDCGSDTDVAECAVEYAPAIFFPNLGVRGEI